MKSLIFLMLRQAKNRLLELKTKPSKLIIYILAIAFIAFMVVQGMGAEMPEAPADSNMFMGILAGFFLFTFAITIMQGFANGAAIFCMEDVNYLFVSPIRPRTILLYGIVKTAKTIVIGSWFIVFQVQWMRGSFGVSVGGMILAAAGYVLLTLVTQVLSLFIYAFTNSRPRRKLAAKIILAAIFVPAAAVFVVQMLQGNALMDALVVLLDSPALVFTPIVGWASAGVSAVIFGETFAGLLFLGLLAASGMFFFGAVYFGNPDYYEDVLGATETAFETARAAQEGQLAAIGGTTRDVKIKGTGLNGTGAKVFFYKHVRESFRANRFGLWGIGSLLTVGGAVVWAFFARPGYGDTGGADGQLLAMLISLMFVKMFMMGYSRGLLETYSHYIYMMPDKPFAKWFWANVETVFKAAVEAVVIFTAAGLILSAPVWTILAAMTALILFTFYVLGISLASMRITDTHLNTGLLLVIYFAVVIIPLLPGIVAAVVIGVVAPGTLAIPLAMLTLSAWMLLVGVGCFALSKGALHNCDMPVMKELGMQ